MLEPTADRGVLIEERWPGYVRYRNEAGRRWEVHGTCDRRGDCLLGSIIPTNDGPVTIESHDHLARLCDRLGRERLDSALDVPVTPEFDTCCGADLFTYVELPSAS